MRRTYGGNCASIRGPVSGSAELDAYHETFPPGDPATPAMVRGRKFELKHGSNERRVLDLDFRAAFGNVQHRTSPGRESPIDGYPRFLIGPSAWRSGFSSECGHGVSTGHWHRRSNKKAPIASLVAGLVAGLGPRRRSGSCSQPCLSKPVNLSQNAAGSLKTLFDMVRFKAGRWPIQNSAS
jgi:hypothetical protein